MYKYHIERFLKTNKGAVYFLVSCDSEAIAEIRKHYPLRSKGLSDKEIMSLIDKKEEKNKCVG